MRRANGCSGWAGQQRALDLWPGMARPPGVQQCPKNALASLRPFSPGRQDPTLIINCQHFPLAGNHAFHQWTQSSLQSTLYERDILLIASLQCRSLETHPLFIEILNDRWGLHAGVHAERHQKGKVVGYWRQHSLLSHVVIRNAGHMVCCCLLRIFVAALT